VRQGWGGSGGKGVARPRTVKRAKQDFFCAKYSQIVVNDAFGGHLVQKCAKMCLVLVVNGASRFKMAPVFVKASSHNCPVFRQKGEIFK